MKLLKILLALGIAVTICFVSLWGCQSQETAENKKKEKQLEEALKVIGEESDAENVYKVRITNMTGSSIIGLSIKESEEKGYVELMDSSDPFVNDESRFLYYEPSKTGDTETTAENESESDKLLLPEYSIQITLEDSTSYELNAFPFSEVEACDLKIEDEVAFIEYKAKDSGESVSTKEAQLAIKEQKEEQERAEAEAKAKAEAEAAAEAAAAEAAAQQQQQQQKQQKQQNTYTPPSSGTTGSDSGCVDDGLFY